jgi:glycosyltransferase involved in cell wall biosynthesis
MTDCVVAQDSQRPLPDGAEVIDFARLGQSRHGLLKHLLRYRRAECWVYRPESLVKPLITAWLLRLLSRRTPQIVSDDGQVQRVHTLYLLAVTARYLRDRLAAPGLIRRIRAEVRAFEAFADPPPTRLDLSCTPVYLRTDLAFGLRSGGSVGHTAGVLNHLDDFCPTPLFLTPDRIPTVRDDLPTHLILPTAHFSDMGELRLLAFSDQVEQQGRAALDQRRIAFIYQRYSLNNLGGARLARHYGVPLVLEYNGSQIWALKHWQGSRLRYPDLAEATELLVLHAAALITVVSQPLRDQLVARGIAPEKILVNPNGVNIDQYRPDLDGSAVRARYGLHDRRVIGFIGTFGAWHGAEVLAEAFGRLIHAHPVYRDRVRLLMIGDGLKMPEVRKHLDHYGVADLTALTGIVPQDQGAEHLAAADILASPHVPNPDGTPFFGSPTKLFEYMAMGRGIVASDLDQIGEILEHDRTAWLVRPGDADDLAAGLKVLLDDPARSARLGAAAREQAVAEFTWRDHTARIIDALKAVMAYQGAVAVGN